MNPWALQCFTLPWWGPEVTWCWPDTSGQVWCWATGDISSSQQLSERQSWWTSSNQITRWLAVLLNLHITSVTLVTWYYFINIINITHSICGIGWNNGIWLVGAIQDFFWEYHFASQVVVRSTYHQQWSLPSAICQLPGLDVVDNWAECVGAHVPTVSLIAFSLMNGEKSVNKITACYMLFGPVTSPLREGIKLRGKKIVESFTKGGGGFLVFFF